MSDDFWEGIACWFARGLLMFMIAVAVIGSIVYHAYTEPQRQRQRQEGYERVESLGTKIPPIGQTFRDEWTRLSLVQLQLREREVPTSEAHGGLFLGIGSFSSSSTVEEVVKYYGYVKDSTGATSLVYMPVGTTLIYEDETTERTRVEAFDLGWLDGTLTATEWRIHVPPGSISRSFMLDLPGMALQTPAQ